MNKPFDKLSDFHAFAWHLMAVKQRPLRRIALASLDRSGAPQMRTLALRDVDAPAATVDLHTDAASCKISELENDPRAAILIWDEVALIQIRLTGHMTIDTGASLGHVWNELPDVTRGNYGVMPAPGTGISQGNAYRREPDAGKFARLTMTVLAMDLVQLQEPSHRRARFLRQDRWAGEWLAP